MDQVADIDIDFTYSPGGSWPNQVSTPGLNGANTKERWSQATSAHLLYGDPSRRKRAGPHDHERQSDDQYQAKQTQAQASR